MSRIGRMPIPIPGGVEVTVSGSHVSVTGGGGARGGGRGTLERVLPAAMRISVNDGTVLVERPTDSRVHRSLHGLTRTLVANMVEGVSRGYTREMDLVGV